MIWGKPVGRDTKKLWQARHRSLPVGRGGSSSASSLACSAAAPWHVSQLTVRWNELFFVAT
jgi:hypothetical protein